PEDQATGRSARLVSWTVGQVTQIETPAVRRAPASAGWGGSPPDSTSRQCAFNRSAPTYTYGPIASGPRHALAALPQARPLDCHGGRGLPDRARDRPACLLPVRVL